MHLTLIRNATLRLRYGGLTILIDPFFAPRHSLPSYTGRSPNPLVDLPLSPKEILDGIDLVLVSHLHGDHFDKTAQEMVPAEMPILCRPGDEVRIRERGFAAVRPLTEAVSVDGVTIAATPGRHGSSPEILAQMGEVCGFLLRAAGEPAVYWAGDTVWYEGVEQTIAREEPDVIITHSGGAVWGENGEKIIMDAAQTRLVRQTAPAAATVVAVHLEALDHCLTTRKEVREIGGVVVLGDGEGVEL